VGECGAGEEKLEEIEMCKKQKKLAKSETKLTESDTKLTEDEKKFKKLVDGWREKPPICEECSKSIDPAEVIVYTFDFKYVFCSAGCRFEWEREHGVGNKGQIEIVEKTVGGN